MTNESPIRVLLVEDNPGDVRLIAESLKSEPGVFELRTVDRIAEIRSALSEFPADVMLLDLGLPDGQGLESFHRVSTLTPGLPIVVLSGLSDQEVAIRAVREGAQDYLVKGRLDGDPLPRIVRHTVERRRADEALRRSEARFRAAVEASPDAFIILEALRDASGRLCEFIVKDVNTRAELFLSRPRDELIGKGLAESLPLEPRDGGVNRYASVIETREAAEDEVSLRREGGGTIWVHRQVIPLGDGVAVVLRDITLRRRMEENLRQTQKMEAVGQLAAGVAHDFRNLLTAIQAHLANARRTLPPGHPALESFDNIDHAVRQAGGVASSMLTFTRKSGNEKSPVNLTSIVEQAVQLVRHSVPSSIRIQMRSEDPTVFVRADPTQLQQVIMNLAINARDAMPSGGVISIRLAPVTGESAIRAGSCGVAKITVSDTGVGMSPEVQARIFEPYFTTKPRGQGTGLGLSIIHGIVADHGGSISVESSEGMGATFTILLPATEPVEVAPPPAPELKVPRAALLIDGNPYVREVIASMLASMNFEVLQAADGAGAERLSRGSGRRFDLIVAASELPDGPGAQWIKRLREIGHMADAVVLSNNGEAAVSDMEHLGVLSSPFRRSDLLHEIERLKGADRRKG